MLNVVLNDQLGSISKYTDLVVTQVFVELDGDLPMWGRGRLLHRGDGDIWCAHQEVT